MQVPEVLDRGRDHAVQVRGLRHVGLHSDRVAAGGRDLCDQRGGLPRVGDVVDDHVRALGSGGEHDRLPDTTVPTCDDN